jgi:hypothetical protein
MSRLSGDWVVLILAVAVVSVSMLISVTPSGRVAIDPGGKLPMPRVCMFRASTGIDCPSCGMTRSFVALGHFDLIGAWHYHRLGPLLYLLVLVQLPLRGLRIAWPRFRERSNPWDGRLHMWILLTMVALLIVNWLIYLATL